FIELLAKEDITYLAGYDIVRNPDEVLIKSDIKAYLSHKYALDEISENEINSIIRDLERYPASDLYESNKAIMKLLRDGLILKREDRSKKDLYVNLIDYSDIGDYIRPPDESLSMVASDAPANYADY